MTQITPNAGHTQGPWRVFDEHGVLAIMPKDHDFEIVHWTGFDGSKYDDDTNRANARLIAAALQAQTYGNATALHLAMVVWTNKARAALAAAKGAGQ